MKTDRFTYEGVPTPCYIIEEDLLRRNLELIRDVSRRAGVEIILAFKAFALWKSVPCFQGIHQPYHGQFPLRGPFGGGRVR